MVAERMSYAAGLVLVLTVVIAAPKAAASTTVEKLRVVLKNDEVAPHHVVRLAQMEVARLFALIDVAIVWETEPAKRGQIIRIKITNWEPADRKIPPAALGVTYEGPRGTRRSYVIWPRVQRTALHASVGLDTMLAVTLAHEMGHMLLPKNPHGRKGLMRASWDENDLRLAAAGLLHFSKDSAVRIAQGLKSGTAIADKTPGADR